MSDLRAITPSHQQADEHDYALRPTRLADYVGQPVMRQRLAVALESAQRRCQPLGHLLLSGPPGLGKTTLAGIIAGEMGSRAYNLSGPALQKPYDMMGHLAQLEFGDVLFVDEAHAVPRVVEEFLYSAMEDFKVDVTFGEGASAKTEAIRVQPFTLVGATTLEGRLTKALRDRFDLHFELELYGVDDLTAIVRRSARLMDLPIEDAAAENIARRARGTPRIANRLLRRVRDYVVVHEASVATLDLADRSLRLEGVDVHGLDDLDRRYLDKLANRYRGRQVGVQVLASALGDMPTTLTEKIEPWLVQCGYVERYPNGRQITPLGKQVLLSGLASLATNGKVPDHV